jgi:methylase of polypeptide subunit release factors
MNKKETFHIQNQEIHIQGDPLVFWPSPHGTKALGGNIRINEGESVLDIGTGTGILAILAAKLGGKVFAVDILDEALECARRNAEMNGADVAFSKSDLFSTVSDGPFDVIIANVPQELLSPKIIDETEAEIVTGMHGGGDGSEALRRTLAKAKAHMAPNSRLYVVVYSMSGWRGSLEYIVKNYKVALLDFYSGAVKSFIYDDLEYYKNEDTIGMYLKGDEYWADIFVFELMLKD